jgi:single-strand DNA-binding protein
MAGMGVNRCTFIGNLGADPVSRTAGNVQVCNCNLAINDRYKGADGNYVDHVTWVRLVFWRTQAETASKYLSKGDLIYVESRVKNRLYEGKDGKPKESVDYEVEKLVMLGQRGEAGSKDAKPAPAAAPARTPASDPANELPHSRPLPAEQADPDEDLPF